MRFVQVAKSSGPARHRRRRVMRNGRKQMNLPTLAVTPADHHGHDPGERAGGGRHRLLPPAAGLPARGGRTLHVRPDPLPQLPPGTDREGDHQAGGGDPVHPFGSQEAQLHHHCRRRQLLYGIHLGPGDRRHPHEGLREDGSGGADLPPDIGPILIFSFNTNDIPVVRGASPPRASICRRTTSCSRRASSTRCGG